MTTQPKKRYTAEFKAQALELHAVKTLTSKSKMIFLKKPQSS
jgi:transposase-like protein